MDTLQIKQLKLNLVIGANAWERQIKQPIWVDLSFQVQADKIAQTDALEETVNYDLAAKSLEAWAQTHEPKLIETAAHQMAMQLIKELGLSWVKLTVSKPQALSNTKGVSITVERTPC